MSFNNYNILIVRVHKDNRSSTKRKLLFPYYSDANTDKIYSYNL